MLHRNLRVHAAAWTIALASVWLIAGCSETPSPLEPQSSSSKKYVPLARTTRAKPAGSEWLEAKATIGVSGGAIQVGDVEIGTSRLTVPAGALSAVTKITMRVSTSGPVIVKFSPHLTFNRGKPATLAISYRGAQVDDDVEQNLSVLYYNEALGEWELVPSAPPDPENDVVAGSLLHFSEYAPGSEPRGGGG